MCNLTAVIAAVYLFLVETILPACLFPDFQTGNLKNSYLFILGHVVQITGHMLNTKDNQKHMFELNGGTVILQHCVLHFRV